GALSAPMELDSVPIRASDDIQRHLAVTGTASPLYAMPLGARQRFLAELKFGRNGVAGFSTAELEDTLTAGQILAVLSLFDLQAYAGMLEGLPELREPREFLTPFERRFNAFDAVVNGDGTKATIEDYWALLAGSEVSVLARSLDPYDRSL